LRHNIRLVFAKLSNEYIDVVIAHSNRLVDIHHPLRENHRNSSETGRGRAHHYPISY
jgi:hypothetical protein